MKKIKKIHMRIVSFMVIIAFIFGMNPTPKSLANGILSKDDAKKMFSSDAGAKMKEKIQTIESSKKSVSKTDDKTPKFAKDEVLVKFKPGSLNIKKYSTTGNGEKRSLQGFQETQVLNFANKNGLEKESYLFKENIAVMKIKDGQSVSDKVNKLKKNSMVEIVQPNFQYHVASVNPNNDPDYQYLWGLHNTGQKVYGVSGTSGADIKAPEAWAISDGGAHAPIVAVLDTGVAYDHPDLASNMWDGSGGCFDENGDSIDGGCPNHGWDFDEVEGIKSPDSDPAPGGYLIDPFWGDIYYSYEPHGTHVAGTIAAADNSTGVIGVAPKAKIMAVKVDGLTTDIIIKGIGFAQNNGAKVINASWGGEGTDDMLKEAIQNFDGLFIAAAGNDGSEIAGDYVPCFDLDNIICVAATDQNDQLASFSNYGSTDVDVAAPGVNILSTLPNSILVNENFSGVTTPALSEGLSVSGSSWQTKDVTYVEDGNLENFGSSYGKVLYGDSQSPYSDNADGAVTSNMLNLSDSQGLNVYFDTACDTQFDDVNWHDYMTFEVSSDGGNNWTEIARWDEAVLGGNNKLGYNFGAYSGDINPSLLSANFKYRFHWITDGSDNNYGGCFVDNLYFTNYTRGNNNTYDYYDGTSMATPHVAGLAALIWGTDNTLTNAQVKDLILNTGDSLSSLNEKTVTGKRINAYNAINQILTVATPIASPAGGAYNETQSVTLSTTTPDTTIYYTTNGDTPTTSSTQYKGAIEISSSTTLNAIAVKSGMNDSDMMSEDYEISLPVSKISLFRPSKATFYLRSSNDDSYTTTKIAYGKSTDIPLVGDWDGDGTDTVGFFRPSTATFYLRNSNTNTYTTTKITYGKSTDIPLVGDWDGDGTDTVGLFRPSTATFYLISSNDSSYTTTEVAYGKSTDKPIVGDWDGDGTDTVGFFRPSKATFYLRSSNDDSYTTTKIAYGKSTDKPIVGNWGEISE